MVILKKVELKIKIVIKFGIFGYILYYCMVNKFILNWKIKIFFVYWNSWFWLGVCVNNEMILEKNDNCFFIFMIKY